MIRYFFRAAVALACCLMTGYAAASAIGPATPDPATQTLARPYATFGFDMLRELRSEQPNTNVFISPTSIAVALAMTANGAGGTTRSAIMQTLRTGGMSMDVFNAANRALRSQIAHTTAVRLAMANALWLQTGFAVRPQFTNTARAVFGAQVGNLDFRNPRSVDTVNAWADKHTDGMIPKVLDTIDPSTVVMLANAIAFKGKWTLPFAPASTAKHNFTTASGTIKTVEMMSHAGRYAYVQSGGVAAIALPYADRSFAMYVVLPENAAALDAFVRGLTTTSFDALIASLQMQSGTIQIPRFRISYDTKLNGALNKLGMGVAFTRAADFRNIRPATRLEISDVHHASFLNVDEEGTQAAAVTTVGIKMLAIRVEPPPFTMIVDHPFLVAIRDERSGQLLFLGTIVDP
ncbi:MAG TPA: serpin family protein [Verrucomicrobiae bacterium]|jgi:serpin B|nr:serpin family protein [Verrucomicrobiae bacterium]